MRRSISKTKKTHAIVVSLAPACNSFTKFNEIFTCAQPVVHEDTISLDDRTILNDRIKQALVTSPYIGIAVDENNLTPGIQKRKNDLDTVET